LVIFFPIAASPDEFYVIKHSRLISIEGAMRQKVFKCNDMNMLDKGVSSNGAKMPNWKVSGVWVQLRRSHYIATVGETNFLQQNIRSD